MAVGFGIAEDALVERQLARDDSGYEALYRQYYRRVLRLCERQVNDRGLAEDLAHDVMLKVFLKLDQFDVDRPMWPWLRVIAQRVIIDHQRGHANPPVLDERELIVDRVDELPSVQERDVLVAALARMPDRQRAALGLRYVQDLDVPHAAQFLGLNRAAYEQLLFRARRRLRREYLRLTTTAAPKIGLVLGPVVDGYRRVRLGVQRAWVSASDSLSAVWLRFDPLHAFGALLATVAVTQLSLATWALLDGDRSVTSARASVPVSSDSTSLVTNHVAVPAESPGDSNRDVTGPDTAPIRLTAGSGLLQPSVQARYFEKRPKGDGRMIHSVVAANVKVPGIDVPDAVPVVGDEEVEWESYWTCDPAKLQERYETSTATCPAIEALYYLRGS
jgi:RNA polymerase sigma-70 factor (ECF subfamily)